MEKKIHKCPFCKREFDDTEYLYSHVTNQHMTPYFRMRTRNVFKF